MRAAWLARRGEMARAALERHADPTEALATLKRLSSENHEGMDRRLTAIAARRTAEIESQLADLAKQLEAERATSADLRSRLSLAMAWGAALVPTEPARPATSFPTATGGDPWIPTSVVYFILSEGSGYVKIGTCAQHLHDRMKSMRTDCGGAPLRVLALLRGGIADERRWHRRFAAKRALGEWFRLAPEDIPATHFDVAEFARSEIPLSGRTCACCGDQFATSRREIMHCPKYPCQKARRGLSAQNVERIRAKKRPRFFNVETPQGFPARLAAEGQSLSGGVRRILYSHLGLHDPGGNARSTSTHAKGRMASVVLDDGAWEKVIEATISAGHHSPQGWAESILRSAA